MRQVIDQKIFQNVEIGEFQLRVKILNDIIELSDSLNLLFEGSNQLSARTKIESLYLDVFRESNPSVSELSDNQLVSLISNLNNQNYSYDRFEDFLFNFKGSDYLITHPTSSYFCTSTITTALLKTCDELGLNSDGFVDNYRARAFAEDAKNLRAYDVISINTDWLETYPRMADVIFVPPHAKKPNSTARMGDSGHSYLVKDFQILEDGKVLLTWVVSSDNSPRTDSKIFTNIYEFNDQYREAKIIRTVKALRAINPNLIVKDDYTEMHGKYSAFYEDLTDKLYDKTLGSFSFVRVFSNDNQDFQVAKHLLRNAVLNVYDDNYISMYEHKELNDVVDILANKINLDDELSNNYKPNDIALENVRKNHFSRE